MRLRLPVRVLAAFVAASALPSVAYSQPRTIPSAADFPAEDYSVWLVVQRGLTMQAANRQLARDPDGADTIALLLAAYRPRPALQVLRRIVERRPDRMAAALKAASEHADRFRDDTRADSTLLRELVARARQRLRELPREDAAEAAWYLIAFYDVPAQGAPHVPWHERLRAYADEYAGTQAAVRAEVELERDADMHSRITSYEAMARRHIGTVAGAYALHTAAMHLGLNIREPRGTDPTERLLRVAALARELQSGAYPDCEWVRRAPDLVLGFSASEGRYVAENVPRVLSVFREFVLKSLKVTPLNPVHSAAGQFIAQKLPAIFADVGGDPIARTDEFLIDLERSAGAPPVLRYLRGEWYGQLGRNPKDVKEPDEWRRRAETTLLDLARAGTELYHRKALASLASVAFRDKNCAVAVERNREYLSRFPQSEWAWVAGLRLGQCHQFLGNWAEARQAYASVTSMRGVVPPALVLGHAFEGRALEALDDLRGARVAYERAERAWDQQFADPNFGTYQFYTRLDEEQCGCDDRSKGDVSREWLRRRSAQLKRSSSLPGGSLLERGRLLVNQGAWKDGVTPLEQFIRLHPESPSRADASNLLGRAKVEIALLQAGPGASEQDKRAALAVLESIGEEPYGFSLFAAQVTRATLLSALGSPSRASTLMTEALTRWHEHGVTRFAGGSVDPLQRDVMDIRDAVFHPYAGWPRGQFSELRSSDTPPPFFIATPDVRVTLADDSHVRIDAASRLAARPGAVLLDEEQIAVLARILTRVCGTDDAGAKQIQRFWNQFFTMGPGHWGGWLIETLPIVHEIAFVDAARTKAGARVRVGYQGHTQLLTKAHGAWKLGGTSGLWIE